MIERQSSGTNRKTGLKCYHVCFACCGLAKLDVVRTEMCMKTDPRVPSSYGTSAWNQVFTVGKNIWAALKNAKVLLN